MPGKKSTQKKAKVRKKHAKSSPEPKPDNSTNDGGAWSLLGYIYQFLGTAGRKLKRLAADATLPDFNDALMTLEVEASGQDIKETDRKEIRLIQLKHSAAASTIPPSELAQILRALDRSEKVLLASDSRKVTWTLCTNRELSDLSKQLRANTPGVKAPKTSKADKQMIRDLGTRLNIELKTASAHRALIEDRAKEFGLTDMRGVAPRVIRYLLDLVQNPIGHRIVEQSHLDEAIAGFDKPCSLRVSQARRVKARQELLDLAERMRGTPLHQIIPRSAIASLLKEPGLAIALVLGHGGCGKTRSVLRGLYDLLEHQDCMVGMLVPGPAVPAESFEDLIARWKTEAAPRPETLHITWRSVLAANESAARPILILALDGIDETAAPDASDRKIGPLIAHFLALSRSSAPDALLIVTCRDKTTFDRFVPDEPGGVQLPEIRTVQLEDFNGTELKEVWTKWFSGERVPDFIASSAAAPLAGGSTVPAKGTDPRFEALKHPALLGCLQRFSPEDRSKLLLGGEKQWIDLLEFYLKWFASKVQQRREYREGDVRAVLQVAAETCGSAANQGGIYDREQHWAAPSVSKTGLPHLSVLRIFQEAVSCGLLMVADSPAYQVSPSKPVRWRWRFDFLPPYLAKLA